MKKLLVILLILDIIVVGGLFAIKLLDIKLPDLKPDAEKTEVTAETISETEAAEEPTAAELAGIIGTWKSTDICSIGGDGSKSYLDAAEYYGITAEMTFSADNTVAVNVQGSINEGTWSAVDGSTYILEEKDADTGESASKTISMTDGTHFEYPIRAGGEMMLVFEKVN